MQTKHKAVGLISGGLDSLLAAKIILEQGIDVYGVHFLMPWNASETSRAEQAAKQIGIPLKNIQLDNDYLEMIQKPRYGYGSAFNPCIDCHGYMIMLAKKYMNEIGADFIFTGEVLGQRPMSQVKQSLALVERISKTEGILVRPLSAALLKPTHPEINGLIDRNRLLKISGRSRSLQIKLAHQFHITNFPNSAGGCLLTDKNFGRRMKDFLTHDYQGYKETIVLQWGRHFRLHEKHKAILGRDETENEALKSFCSPQDFILELPDKKGPTLILTGSHPQQEILKISAGLIQHFSKNKQRTSPFMINYWQKKSPTHISQIAPIVLSVQDVEKIKI